ncbi:hypothetical protein Leryth_016885 [Lithospermum erythrorhizon]|nr:hypothetical protein Leryth_016885 [Lithospermum erythrorhizon]
MTVHLLMIEKHPSEAQVMVLCSASVNRQPAALLGYIVRAPTVLQGRGALIAKAYTDIDGTGSSDAETPSESEDEDENVGIMDLPLESKLQLKLEQKMKMKLPKNIRLRRKKIARKRRLRKKGRWPPSKMKENKNV